MPLRVSKMRPHRTIAGMPSTISWSALLLAPLMGRVAVPLLFATTPYVRMNGLGEALARYQSRTAAIVLSILVLIVACTFAGWAGARGVLAAVFVLFVVHRLSIARIGGFTGDVAGAMVELTEATVLVSLCVWPVDWSK